MLNDFEVVNDILAQLADEGTIEPMVEPCDENGSHPLDWAEAAGIFDDIAGIIYGDPVEA